MTEIKPQQILAFSFDRPTVPVAQLQFMPDLHEHKLSLGWYDTDNRTGSVINSVLSKESCQSFLNDTQMQQRYAAGNMLIGIEQKLLMYSLNNRDWFIIINLQNDNKKPDRLSFTAQAPFTTRSNSNEKIYGAWLMSQLLQKDVAALKELNYQEIYEWFEKINAENHCTIILSDGLDTVFYQGSDFANSLYYVRSCPPHEHFGLFKSGHFEFQMNALDLNHTVFFVSSEQIEHSNSVFFNLNQMMVVRSAEIVWNKDPQALVTEIVHELPLPEPVEHHYYLHKTNLLKVVCHEEGQESYITIPAESTDKEPRIYSILHKTVYEYDTPVSLSKHLFRLQPFSDLSQTLLEYELVVLADGMPVKAIPCNMIGAFGNNASYIKVEQPYTRLEVICRSTVSILDPTPKRFDLLRENTTIPVIWMPWDRIMMQAYLVPPELPESQLRELSDYALSFVKRNNNDVYEVLNDINKTIYQDYTYQAGSTTLETTPFEVYARHKGVCQDFANLFICLARLLNIPARYCTGYVYTAADYANQLQGEASHAWLEVFLPFVGWQGFDPTNYCLVGKNHIRVACGRTYLDAAPTSGTIFRGGGGETMDVEVQVLLLDNYVCKK